MITPPAKIINILQKFLEENKLPHVLIDKFFYATDVLLQKHLEDFIDGGSQTHSIGFVLEEDERGIVVTLKHGLFEIGFTKVISMEESLKNKTE